MLSLLTDRLTDEQRQTGLQLIRFGLSGGIATAVSLVVYAAVAVWQHGPPQLANFAAYLIAVCVGYVLHSRWSFRGYGQRDNVARTTGRFAIVSFVSLGLNSLWVWLITHVLGLSPAWPMVPMLFVTPLATFMLNRLWVFA
ncbi:MAG: GtrA family protein [Sphingomicrobium sp.]|nr:GtrA family protein [Sphingomonadales bacterium]